MSMLKDNIEDRYIEDDDASPQGHPASYSPGYQRLQKKPKVASYITLRPYTMLQAILLSLFGVGILSVKILSPVQRLLITKLPRCQKVSTPSPLGSRQGSPTPTNDFVSHHSSAPTTFLSPPPPLVGTMQGREKIQKHSKLFTAAASFEHIGPLGRDLQRH